MFSDELLKGHTCFKNPVLETSSWKFVSGFLTGAFHAVLHHTVSVGDLGYFWLPPVINKLSFWLGNLWSHLFDCSPTRR